MGVIEQPTPTRASEITRVDINLISCEYKPKTITDLLACNLKN